MKAILFDLDGTLIDSSEGITKSAQYALSHFGIDEPDRNSLFFFIGPPLINTFMEHLKRSKSTENAITKEVYLNVRFVRG